MRVLILHNRYRQRGGEDTVADAEGRMLRANGIEVIEEICSNEVEESSQTFGTLRLLLASGWSQDSYKVVSELCHKYRPDIVHVHNFWMRLSPAIHAAAWEAGAATVQTLHNFRLLCANAMFLRNGSVCEDCLGKGPWRGAIHRCYRDSYVASTAVANMIAENRRRNTWDQYVAAFIALTAHSQSRFVAGNIPANRIFVKPNFVVDPGLSITPASSSNKVMYVGRLSQEKGVATLIRAWAQERLSERGQLLIVGDGPERENLHRLAESLGMNSSDISFLGLKPRSEITRLLEQARCIVIPSIWYEALPITIPEAFSHSRPVVTSRIGGLGELVVDGQTGFTVPSANVDDLGRKLRSILSDDDLTDCLAKNARAEFINKYTPEKNFDLLMQIYRFAIEFRLSRTKIKIAAASAG